MIVGQTATFDAKAVGFPDPIVRWKRQLVGDHEFKVVISNANVQSLENGSLAIREPVRQDSGLYMVQAVNGIGAGISLVVRLDVHGSCLIESRMHATRPGLGSACSRALNPPPH